jgi:hypothetical protein
MTHQCTCAHAANPDYLLLDQQWEAALEAEIVQLRRQTLQECNDPYFVVPAGKTPDGADVGFAWGWGEYHDDTTCYLTEDAAWEAAWEDAKATVTKLNRLDLGYFLGMTEHREIRAVDDFLNAWFG